MQSTLTPRRELWLLLTLAGIQFSHIVDFMIMMPLGPQFTRLFLITDAQFGLLVSAYTFAAGVSGLLAAFYVDRFGRKKLLLWLYALFALATLACGLAPTYEALMVARIAAGAFGGVLSALAQTIVADVIPFERRGRAMAITMSSFSLATVAGVPIGLFLAAHMGWHAPFIAIAAVCAVLAVIAARTMPSLSGHLLMKNRPSPIAGILQVLRDPNHQKAFGFSTLLMFAGFTMIPYITIYTTTNAGLTDQQVPYIYLCGGAATLVTARIVGRLTDKLGKVVMFRRVALATMVPMFLLTVAAGLPLWGILTLSTLFFVCMSGRMIPGMAIITSTADPRLRGTFMTLNSSVQSVGMGVAAFIGGLIISRDAQGLVQHYWGNALLGMVASGISIWLAGKLFLYGAAVNPVLPPSAMAVTK
jgi:predicted MFS family arabinose efflux permease